MARGNTLLMSLQWTNDQRFKRVVSKMRLVRCILTGWKLCLTSKMKRVELKQGQRKGQNPNGMAKYDHYLSFYQVTIQTLKVSFKNRLF